MTSCILILPILSKDPDPDQDSAGSEITWPPGSGPVF